MCVTSEALLIWLSVIIVEIVWFWHSFFQMPFLTPTTLLEVYSLCNLRVPKIYVILFWPDKAHYLFNVLLQDQTCVGCNTHNSVPSQNRQKCACIDFNSSYHSIMYNLPTDIIDERFLKSVQKKQRRSQETFKQLFCRPAKVLKNISIQFLHNRKRDITLIWLFQS